MGDIAIADEGEITKPKQGQYQVQIAWKYNKERKTCKVTGRFLRGGKVLRPSPRAKQISSDSCTKYHLIEMFYALKEHYNDRIAGRGAKSWLNFAGAIDSLRNEIFFGTRTS